MRLSELLREVEFEGSIKNDFDIKFVTDDSRLVRPGALFVCIRHRSFDGHTAAAEALASGAAAVVTQERLGLENELNVVDSRAAYARLCAALCGHPERKLRMIGVTGTNGKTTVTTLIRNILSDSGIKTLLTGTVCNRLGEESLPSGLTTPKPPELYSLLSRAVLSGCEACVAEASSQALAQGRLEGIAFDAAVFTNITRDHLDYHKTVEAYIKAKKMFFDGLGADAFALVNADDKVGSVMVQNCKAKHYTYSLRTLADFKAQVIEERLDGTTITLDGQELEVLFTGRFNVYNLASVYGAALLLGFDKSEVLVKISMLKPVSGRFQTMRSPRGYIAVVDYAHTPDALVNVLTAINDVVCGKGQVITVCGCGGDRDHGKRPMMAAEAANRSDQVILTSDNPRSEDPEEILRQMEAGLDDSNRSRVLKITDRREAIKVACRLAKKGDVVLVAGKGHETYQEIKGVKHHFDDREVLADIFNDEK